MNSFETIGSPFFILLAIFFLAVLIFLKRNFKSEMNFLWVFPVLVYALSFGSYKKMALFSYFLQMKEHPLQGVLVFLMLVGLTALLVLGMRAAPIFLEKKQRARKKWFLFLPPLILSAGVEAGFTEKAKIFAFVAACIWVLCLVFGAFLQGFQKIATALGVLGAFVFIGSEVIHGLHEGSDFAHAVFASRSSVFWLVLGITSYFQFRKGWNVDTHSDFLQIQKIDGWLRGTWLIFFLGVAFGSYSAWWSRGVWFTYSQRELLVGLVFVLLTLACGWSRWGYASYRRGLSFVFISLWVVLQFLNRFEIGFFS